MSKYVPSIIQTGPAKCYLCGRQYGLEVHHAIPGTGNRKICTELGLTVWLCDKCHRDLHDHSKAYAQIKADAQNAYINKRLNEGVTRADALKEWYSRFLKFYDL